MKKFILAGVLLASSQVMAANADTKSMMYRCAYVASVLDLDKDFEIFLLGAGSLENAEFKELDEPNRTLRDSGYFNYGFAVGFIDGIAVGYDKESEENEFYRTFFYKHCKKEELYQYALDLYNKKKNKD